MTIVGGAAYGDDIIVFKRGDREKRIYRLNTADPTPANWYVSELSENNTAQNSLAMVTAFNNVFFVDTNGFKSIKGVTEYGDMQTDLIGGKVNPAFAGSAICDFCTYVPLYAAIWFGVSSRVYVYHRIADADGSVQHAFTELIFQQGRICCLCQAGSTLYLGGYNGYLYKIDTGVSTDGTAPGVVEAFSSVLRTKQFPMFGEGILRKTEVYLKPVTSGTAILSAFNGPETSVNIKSVVLRGMGEELVGATGGLDAATTFLFDGGVQAWFETSYNRVRGRTLQFQFSVSSGRVGVQGLKAEIAPVAG
jgi:hypothetical protein